MDIPEQRHLKRGPFAIEPGQRLILRNKSGTIVAVVGFDDNAMLQAGGTVRTAAWVRHDIVEIADTPSRHPGNLSCEAQRAKREGRDPDLTT